MAFALQEDVRLRLDDLPVSRDAPNAASAGTGGALFHAWFPSLLGVGRLVAIYRSRAPPRDASELSAFPYASARSDDGAASTPDRARLPRRRNVLARLVLSPRRAAVLDRAGRPARQGKMSSASSTRMANGSKREGVAALKPPRLRPRSTVGFVMSSGFETSLISGSTQAIGRRSRDSSDGACPERSRRHRMTRTAFVISSPTRK